jgi:hypothetical protein
MLYACSMRPRAINGLCKTPLVSGLWLLHLDLHKLRATVLNPERLIKCSLFGLRYLVIPTWRRTGDRKDGRTPAAAISSSSNSIALNFQEQVLPFHVHHNTASSIRQAFLQHAASSLQVASSNNVGSFLT